MTTKPQRKTETSFTAAYFIEESGYDLGDTVTMTMGDAGGEARFQGTMTGAFGSSNYDWIITDEAYDQLGLSGKSIGTIWVDCRPQDCADVQNQLEDLLTDKQHYEFSTYQGALETSESSLGMFETLAYGFLLLVGLIAFMNMANTIIISIITRKRELGVMQALGMTNSQMNSMLRNEGVLFTAGNIDSSSSACRQDTHFSATEENTDTSVWMCTISRSSRSLP